MLTDSQIFNKYNIPLIVQEQIKQLVFIDKGKIKKD